MTEISVWSTGGMVMSGKTEVLGIKPVQVPLCSSQIPHKMPYDRSRPEWWDAVKPPPAVWHVLLIIWVCL